MTDSVPPLGPLSLTGGNIDRGGQDRRDTAWLVTALASPDTRVLALVKGATQVQGERSIYLDLTLDLANRQAGTERFT
jgi:hypothetical protein